jgi:integrase
MPEERNPRQPVADRDRYEAIMAVAPGIGYLAEILPIMAWTGRRATAVCSLTFGDLRLDEGPHGSIRWPASTDKRKKEFTAPIAPQVREVLDKILRERPGIGNAPLFPSPRNRSKPIRYELALDWLRKAEKKAKIPKQERGAFHAFRRMWATERKHLPDIDVAAAGGWSDTRALKASYQHADPDTMRRVVTEPRELRSNRK